ncbi:hypothetical protein N431DRAFT_489827 [Stipitochalara longipes BDJ]|nr:hypothetical protein N431DRAFT_489827 [Stipitochalara longipes BDJ]
MSNHNHFGMPAGYRHVCMMEGPDPTASLASRRYDTLEKENKNHVDEIKRLKAILAAHKIPSEPAVNITVQPRRRTPRCSTQAPSKPLPKLPIEIQLRILSHALSCPDPIIDPFYKLRRDTVTKKESSRKKQINIHFLTTCKAFQVEGLRLLFANNSFIFTQVPALENFAKLPIHLRSTVKQVTLRVVGRYYDEVAGRRDLTGNVPYHSSVEKLMLPILARPSGMIEDKGIQAYCWEQLADFLKALLTPTPASAFRQKLLPGLDSLRIDLVNFCDHLPYGGYQLSSLIRWHIGQIADELLVTGAPEADMTDDGYSTEERVLHQLVRDEGLIGSAIPQFVSISSGLKPLKPNGIAQQIIRANKEPKFQSAKTLIHPEGGEPPKSAYKPGKTIWKWTSDSLANPEKRWIEFDRRSGLPADDIDMDMWSDIDD